MAVNEWKCSYCGKTFKSEKYIDKHMEIKHHDKLQMHSLGSVPVTVTESESETVSNNNSEGGGEGEDVGVCLADMCHVIGCQLYTKTVMRDIDESSDSSSYHIRNVNGGQSQSNDRNSNSNSGSSSISVAKTFSEVHSCNTADITKIRVTCSAIMEGYVAYMYT